MSERPLLLFGGTFNPVHKAHLEAALAASDALGGAKVDFLPNARSPFKQQSGASGEQRLEMLAIALADQPRFTINRWEVERPAPSRSIHCLEHFRAQQGKAPLVLIMGADSFAKLHLWHQWQRFPALCHLLVLPRPDSPPPSEETLAAFPQANAAELLARPAGCRLMLNAPLIDLSATEIRRLDDAQRQPLLPEGVADYIRQQHLYGEGSAKPL